MLTHAGNTGCSRSATLRFFTPFLIVLVSIVAQTHRLNQAMAKQIILVIKLLLMGIDHKKAEMTPALFFNTESNTSWQHLIFIVTFIFYAQTNPRPRSIRSLNSRPLGWAL